MTGSSRSAPPPTSVRPSPTGQPRSAICPAGSCCPGFQDAHVHPPQAGRNRLTVDLDGLAGTDGLRRRRRRLRRRPPGRGVDRRRRLVDGALPGRDAHQGAARRRRAGSAGLPLQPRRPRRLGQLGCPAARRHRPEHPRPGRRSDRARPGDRRTVRHAARGSGVPDRRARRPAAVPGCLACGDPGLAAAPALARHHRLAGRLGHPRHPAGLRATGRERRADRSRRRIALVGPQPWDRAGQRPGRTGGGPQRTTRCPAPVSTRQPSRSCSTASWRTSPAHCSSPTATGTAVTAATAG